ncbi:MAG: hypothetical protein LQ338_003627 [Usnochroma carphineum]|nr:MAG: hypothetical protein LQ338_003627 [Usnochroma carphineum]
MSPATAGPWKTTAKMKHTNQQNVIDRVAPTPRRSCPDSEITLASPSLALALAAWSTRPEIDDPVNEH